MPHSEKIITTCSQEPRVAHLESTLAGIADTLKDVKELLKASALADERINTLQKENLDQEKRLRHMESAIASGRWLERVAWMVVAAGLGWFFHKG